MRAGRAVILVACLASAWGGAAQAQDATKGAQVFKICSTCHRVGDNAKNFIGPVLNGIVGRRTGTYPGYNYSDLNKQAGEAGLVWTEDNIFDYLADPSAFLKKYLTDHGKADQAVGTTKMPIKLAGEQQRKDVIAYLKTFSKP